VKLPKYTATFVAEHCIICIAYYEEKKNTPIITTLCRSNATTKKGLSFLLVWFGLVGVVVVRSLEERASFQLDFPS
jgi:hypothetical protein